MTDPTPNPGQGAPTGAPEATPPTPSAPDPGLAKANAAMRKALAEKEKELEALKAAAMSEQEKAVAAAKAQGADEYRAKYVQTLVTNTALSVLTAKGIVAPELALGAMNLSNVDVDPATGHVDRTAIEAMVDDVIARYPMLSAQAAGSNFRPATGGDQRPVTQADLTSGKDDMAKLNETLRWALGGSSR